ELEQVFSRQAAAAYLNLTLNEEIGNTQKEMIFAIGEVVETRSKETGQHVRRVGEISRLLARLHGLREEEAELLCFASPMHDVGKIGIPDQVLNKPAALTTDEFQIMKSHCEIGHNIFRHSKRRILRTAAIICNPHHERWDGTGYPLGLAGEQIHIFGRITAIADVFDALYHDRVYKKAWPLADITEHFKQGRGSQFDPVLVDLLLEHLDEFIAIQNALPNQPLSSC
ncbi:MAG: HD domain-containing protein, partial [Magnetococcales bacterium]|nr:HD domain-containing protein [Magnetococcales bacterium]